VLASPPIGSDLDHIWTGWTGRRIWATDLRRLSPIGLNQKVLAIYVQASDFQIVPGELAALNTGFSRQEIIYGAPQQPCSNDYYYYDPNVRFHIRQSDNF
jgi:hypothetical protein